MAWSELYTFLLNLPTPWKVVALLVIVIIVAFAVVGVYLILKSSKNKNPPKNLTVTPSTISKKNSSKAVPALPTGTRTAEQQAALEQLGKQLGRGYTGRPDFDLWH